LSSRQWPIQPCGSGWLIWARRFRCVHNRRRTRLLFTTRLKSRSGGLSSRQRTSRENRPVRYEHLRRATMKLLRRQILHLAAVSIASAILVALPGEGTRSIRLVVPYAAGGVGEAMSRLLADQISRMGGPPFLIESRPGAGTVLATDAVSRAAPDGNTILLVGNSFVINPHVRKLAYHPLTGFEPICYLCRSPAVIAVNSASPYRTLTDLLGAARATPGALTMGASGPLTGFHIGFERLK